MAIALSNLNLADANAAVVADYPFTLAGWFRVPDAGSLMQLMGLESAAGDARYHLYFAGHSGNRVVANAFLGDYGRAISAAAMVPGQWHHVAGVFHSATLREVYLDGVLSGSNTTDRAFAGDDYLYCGNKDSSYAVEVAEAFVAAAALSAAQVAALARGCGAIAVAGLGNLRAYQDCVAGLNRPGIGPVLTSAAAIARTDHPRLFIGAGCGMTAAAYRVAGPWTREAAQGSVAAGEAGEISVAGADGAAALAGEVTS